jgi:hypothetical protein
VEIWELVGKDKVSQFCIGTRGESKWLRFSISRKKTPALVYQRAYK